MKRACAFLAVLLLASLSRAQAPTSAPLTSKPEEECTISGSVVKLAGGEPLRKARVFLQATDDRTREFSAITNAAGQFQIKGIDPGTYKLTVSRAGFVSQEYSQKKPGGPGAVLTLHSQQEVHDLIFRLIPAAVIAGKILDDDGEPLASVQVSALRETYSEGKRAFSTQGIVSTNDLGEYRLFGLAPGRYFVSAVYPHWGRFGNNEDDSGSPQQEAGGYAKMYYPGTPDRAKATPITLKPGDEIPSTEILMRQVLVYHVRGHVFNQITHKPGTEMNVMLMPRKKTHDWEFSDLEANVEKKDGSFDIAEVLPGSYSLVAFWFDEGKVYTSSVAVDVGNANVEGLNVALGPGVTINGQIVWEGHPSLDKDELTISLDPIDFFRFFSGPTRVAQNNTFVLKDVGEGTYRVNVVGQSKDCYVKDVRYGESAALDEGLTVTRGTPASLEVIINSRGARVQGAVVDADGLPATGVWVALVPEESRRTASRLYKSGTTDQYGHFDLHGIAPGEYKLFSWEEAESGAWEDPEFLKPFEDKGERISFQEGDQKSLNFTAIRTKAPESANR